MAGEAEVGAVVVERGVAQAFAQVARVLQAQGSAAEVLQRMVELARETVPGCEHAGVSLVQGHAISTPATTGSVPVVVDRIQYETDQGPCLSAARQQVSVEAVEAVDLTTESRWPLFTARAVAETGVRSMLSFQLFLQEEVLGALNLYSTTAGAFSDESHLVGEAFAGHAAVALTSALAAEEAVRVQQDLDTSLARGAVLAERAEVGAVLQASMLTDLTRLPQPDHLELGALYRPAAVGHEVGGDWYDAFVLADGSTAVVIGDVSGHDIAAAATMGALRSMLRAIAWDRGASPAQTLTRVDGAIAGLGVEAISSVLLARIEQTGEDREDGLRRLRWSNAGHLPPVLVCPGEAVRLLDEPGDLLLGVQADLARTDCVTALPAGSTLLLYTDGLVERRGEHLQDGLDRLLAAVQELGDLPLAELVSELAQRLAGHSSHAREGGSDDTAILAVRLHPQLAFRS